MTERGIRRKPIWIASGILLTFLVVMAVTLTSESLWEDEVWSLWAAKGSLEVTIARVAGDYHPPLYFLLLKGWIGLVGDAPMMVRLPSVYAAMLGLAFTYALGRRLWGHRAGLIAAAVLGVLPVMLYYARETRMYSLLILLGAAALWLYWRWWFRPRWARAWPLIVVLAALPYAQYHGGWLAVALSAHVLVTRPRLWWRWALIGFGAGLLFAPWVPVMLRQNAARPALLLAAARPSNLATLGWIIANLSGGLGLLVIAPYALREGREALRRTWQAALLVGLVLIVPVGIVLAINTRLPVFYHFRYFAEVIPALALLIGVGAARVRWPVLRGVLIAALVIVPLLNYRMFWPPRPDYRGRIAGFVDDIAPGGALMLDLHPDNLVAYYDRHDGHDLRGRATYDLSGAVDDPDQVAAMLGAVGDEPAVWVALPSNVGRSWAIMAALDADRSPALASGVQNMMLYRFDIGAGDLQYQFGDLVVYVEGPQGGVLQVEDGQVCISMTLEALSGIDGRYSAGVHVVGADGMSRGQWDQGLGVRQEEDEIALSPCVAVPEEPGVYYVQLTVYDWTNLQRVVLLEVSGEEAVEWGDTLVVGWIEQQ